MLEDYKKISKADWFVLGVLVLAAVASFFLKLPDGKLHVWFLDVGQGDAEFIQTPSGQQVLIDGGPDATILRRLGEVMPFYDRSIDLVILTHPHADHVSGLNEVFKKYEVASILENHVPYETANYAEWNELKNKAQITEAKAGQIIDLGKGATLTVLYPNSSGTVKSKVKNAHDFMVVMKLVYGGESLLLTGDLEAKLEQLLINEKLDLTSQFLKIGHHGSRTSTSENFLKAVAPLAAFIEVGAHNRYGHPTAEILSRLEKYGVKYYRTDTDGTVELVLDGKNYLIK